MATGPFPPRLSAAARDVGATLHSLGDQFDFTPGRPTWSWRGRLAAVDGLEYAPGATLAQLRNASIVLATLEQFDPARLADSGALNAIITTARPPGRFQVVRREHEWILDVAHNPQAVATLREQLGLLPPAADTTLVIGILGDKSLDAFVAELGPLARRWICLHRGRSAGPFRRVHRIAPRGARCRRYHPVRLAGAGIGLRTRSHGSRRAHRRLRLIPGRRSRAPLAWHILKNQLGTRDFMERKLQERMVGAAS